MRIAVGPLLALILLIMPACQKSEAQVASDALARGLEAHNQGRLDEATAAYRAVLAHDPNNKYAFYNLGVIDQFAGRATAAESNYRLALSIDPDYAPAAYNLAIIRTAAGSTDEAIDLYKRAVGSQPGWAAAHWNLGLMLRAAGQSQAAEAELARAQQLDPTLRVPTVVPSTPAPTAEPPGASAP